MIPCIFSLLFLSCEIVQEVRFNPDGSGNFTLGINVFDLSSLSKNSGGKMPMNKQLDTLFVMSDFIERKKDSISKLSTEEQEKIKQLKDFSFRIKLDTILRKGKLDILYNFSDIKELKKFGDKLKSQNINSLNSTIDILKDTEKKKKFGFFDVSKRDFKFNKRKFSSKINSETLKKVKHNTLKNNPMMKMFQFKTRYIFPYKIKKIDNENAKILSDSKSVELSTSLYDIINDPESSNLTIKFKR